VRKFSRVKKGYKIPYRPTGYVEKPEEKAARTQTGERNVLHFKRYYSPALKKVKYAVPGLDLDTFETLKTDGLITEDKKDGESSIKFLEPENLRVLAWVMGLNETCRLHGLAEQFPGLMPDYIALEAPTTGTVH